METWESIPHPNIFPQFNLILQNFLTINRQLIILWLRVISLI